MENNDFLFKRITEGIANTDFSGYTIQYPPMFLWGKARSNREILRSWSESLANNFRHLGLYVHIPFCKQKCSFCRYFSQELAQRAALKDYLAALKKEIKIYKPLFSKFPLSSVYLGGGTPALLNLGQLKELFDTLYKSFNLNQCQQISFEGNPDFLPWPKLKLLKKYGVNRLTIGIQSLDSRVLESANRYQSKESFERCFQDARNAGIANINVDLMAGLSGQTAKSVLKTLEEVIRLRPEMIHIHPFYPTALTAFMQAGGQLSKEEMDLREHLAKISQAVIRQAGYAAIEFDANGLNPAARNVQLSDAIEHNSAFLGLGAGAVSHATGYSRYVNLNDPDKYCYSLSQGKLPIQSTCRLTQRDEMIYFITSWLRYGRVSKERFRDIFKKDPDKVFAKEIAYLKTRKKIKDTPGFLCSKSANMGEYAIFSKYFYDQKIIAKCRAILSPLAGRIKRADMKYLYF